MSKMIERRSAAEYYASAGFPSGEIKCAVFDTRVQAERQANKYAAQGAHSTKVRKEVA